jgi:ABC-2 type transport system permease protein
MLYTGLTTHSRMTFILILSLFLIGLNLIPELIKRDSDNLEKAVRNILVVSTFLFLTVVFLPLVGLRLKGLFTSRLIGIVFLTTSLAYFAVNENTWKKVVFVMVLLPILLESFLLLMNKNLGSYEVNDTLEINVTQEGFISCGETVRLTKSWFLLFDKELLSITNLCLVGISDIETISIDDSKATILIYHSGETDSENPYLLEIENQNVW